MRSRLIQTAGVVKLPEGAPIFGDVVEVYGEMSARRKKSKEALEDMQKVCGRK
ncbi:MAG TPA: hypothetical protein VMT52_03410 [Planctomycetota bacterium]|nr:hypothetical protein [Planctomycetota bacterium]